MNTDLDCFAQNAPRVALGQIATSVLVLGLWAANVAFSQSAHMSEAPAAAVQVASATTSPSGFDFK
jgi:hypothetical protein